MVDFCIHMYSWLVLVFTVDFCHSRRKNTPDRSTSLVISGICLQVGANTPRPPQQLSTLALFPSIYCPSAGRILSLWRDPPFVDIFIHLFLPPSQPFCIVYSLIINPLSYQHVYPFITLLPLSTSSVSPLFRFCSPPIIVFFSCSTTFTRSSAARLLCTVYQVISHFYPPFIHS